MTPEQRVKQLEAENAELRKVYSSNCPECGYEGCVRGKKACDLEIDQLRAENLQMLRALQKIADGPGNKMAFWKETWASRYAVDQLNRQEHTAYLAIKLELMELVVKHASACTEESIKLFFEAKQQLDDHEARKPG